MGGVVNHQSSLAEKTRNVNCEEEEMQGFQIQHTALHETDEVRQGEKNVSTRLYYQGLQSKRTDQSNPKNNAKIWSLTDENTVSKRKHRKGIIYQAKTKVNRVIFSNFCYLSSMVLLRLVSRDKNLKRA